MRGNILLDISAVDPFHVKFYTNLKINLNNITFFTILFDRI